MGHCAGQIHGDSDIAGVGVNIYQPEKMTPCWQLIIQIKIISAIFVNAGLTIAVSASLWIYIYIHLRKDHLENPRSLPDWVQVVRSALVVQGDTQLIAALAIIITSLIHMKSDVKTPLYHTFIARSLVDVALTGHAAAVVHVYPTQHNWVSRFALLAATMFLWQWWTWLTIQLFRDSSRKAEHCFTNTNGLPGQYTSWIWTSLWSTPVGYMVLYLNSLENGRTLTNQFEEILMAGPTFVRKTFSFRQKTSKASCSRSDFVDVLRDVAISTGFIGIIFISWSFALLLPCSRILNPLQSLISFTWNLFDVSALHGANYEMLVENSEKLPKVSFQVFEDPEARRGFGQVLPFVMLLFPILAALDFYSGTPRPF